jgi:multicomponent K+:H+ antiporter subunit D
VTAAALLMLPRLAAGSRRALSAASVAALLGVSVLLLNAVDDDLIRTYRVGDWPAPFGIVLVADRLAAIMVALTALLAGAAALAAASGIDAAGRHFYAFFHLQLAGLNGAFLTGDLFNLFVFFEILLLASYALLVHGGGLERTRAGLAYVVINLTGSALFLIALGLTYGTLGTLNMADLAHVLSRIAPEDQPLMRTTLALLTTVFVLKAALLPLGFWLPHVYTAASLPAAILFVIMTKVGVYALLRVATVGFATAHYSADLLTPWLFWLAIGTIALGAIVALAAVRFATVVASIVIISSGTLLLGIADGSAAAHAAMLFYLLNTTVVAAGLFLLSDIVARQRGAFGDALEKGPHLPAARTLGGAYLFLAVAASGVPPLSGFLAKLMLMQSLASSGMVSVAWSALLLSGFVVALVLARAASTFFWETGRGEMPEHGFKPVAVPSLGSRHTEVALLGTVVCACAITLGAAPISNYARDTAAQLARPASYVEAVLGDPAAIRRERRP